MEKYNNKICAGVVTYNPDLELTVKCIKALSTQVDKVFICDNGSNNVPDLDCLKKKNSNLDIIYNEKNLGIAKALNQLCEKASHEGYGWILTMDQDSICDEKMVFYLSSYIGRGNYGIIAPRVEFWNGDLLLTSTKYPEKETYEFQACITSGSLTNISAWKKIGGFDEWMFIDHVDDDFGIRLRDAGFKLLRVNNALLYQRAGEMKYRIKKNGKPMMLTYYSSFRQYYICRNTVYFLRKHNNSKNVRVCRYWGIFFYIILTKLIYEKGRWAALKSSVRGISDGFRKKIRYVDYVNP